MNFRDINALVKQRQSEIAGVAARAGDTVYGTVAPLWKDMFAKRPNFLSPEQFHLFRHPSTLGIAGVGTQPDQNELSALEEQNMPGVVDAHNVPDEVIAKLAEPVIGAPVVHPYRGNLFSPAFLSNVPPVWRVIQAVKRFGPKRPLRIGEIGAGFGAGAVILHQLLDVESYTIIDLPENLYLSSLFIPTSLGRTHNVVDPLKPESLHCGAQLNFSLASFTDELKAAPFDLIWNRASMGEMTRATAAAYISWIKEHLAPDGIFFFANRFNVPKTDGAARLSDYGLQNFGVHSISHAEWLHRPHNQIHTEVVAGRSGQGASVRAAHLDIIGDLVACGFGSQIARYCDAVTKGNVTPEVQAAFDILAAVFRPSPLQEKYELLQSPAAKVLGDIGTVLLTAAELVGGAYAAAAGRKAAVLNLDLGFKLELRLRTLYAEQEFRQSNASWAETLRPARAKSESLARMSELLIKQGKTTITTRFTRDMRVTA